MYLFYMNLKLIEDLIYKWSLPAPLSCPASGDCLNYCYMKSVYRLRGAVCVKAHERNFELSKKACFVAVAIHELKSRPYIKYLRIHDSGDFYSQGYLNKWCRIAEACPSVFFYAYTKSLHLDFKRFKALNNVKVIQSEGGKYKVDKRGAHAVLLPAGARMPVGYVDASSSDRLAFNSNRIALYKRG